MAQAQLSSIIPKLHRNLMPTLLMMYMLAFLDRANVGFAREGLETDAGIGAAAFAFGASVFFIGYAVLEVPSNLILHRIGDCLRAGPHILLCHPLPAGHGRGRFLSRRDLLPHLLVSGLGAGAVGRHVLLRRATGTDLWRSDIGTVGGA
jgi:hypothetical protein